MKNLVSLLPLILFFSCLIGCTKTQHDLPKSQNRSLVGIYECVQDPGLNVLGKHWGRKYWQLKLSAHGDTLSFNDDVHGKNDFELAVLVVEEESELKVYYQATGYTAYAAPMELEHLKKGDFLASFHTVGDDLITRSPFLYIADSPLVESFLFQKATSAAPSESDQL